MMPSWSGPGTASVTPTRCCAGAAARQGGRGRVVDARDRDRPAQRPRLGGGVGGHRAVPVEVVLGDVEHAPDGGHDRRRPMQLEARQLDGQHVPTLVDGRRRPGGRCCRTPPCRRPAARRIASSMPTVVVLPFVPVTASHGAGCAARACAIHQASSGSPTTGSPAAAAATARASSGRRPGPVTTSARSADSSCGPATAPSRQVGQRLRPGVGDGHARAEPQQRSSRRPPGDPGARDEHVRAAQLVDLHLLSRPREAVSHSL